MSKASGKLLWQLNIPLTLYSEPRIIGSALELHRQDFIHFNVKGEFDLVYSRVDLDAMTQKERYGEHGFPFYFGDYVPVSEEIFDSVSDYSPTGV